MQVFKMTKIYRIISEKMDDTMETESMESGVRETDWSSYTKAGRELKCAIIVQREFNEIIDCQSVR